uniref:hypothetical protein n=1 Tax=Clostridium sp. NkU-1 TaxID=1095009 RepID=UPI0006D0E595
MKKEPKSVKVSARITVRADEKLSWEAQKAKLSKSRYLEQLILKKRCGCYQRSGRIYTRLEILR